MGLRATKDGARLMRGVRSRGRGQTWATFLRNHAEDIWACDCAQTYDIFFRQVYAFFIVHLASRRVVHVAASRNPTQEWTAQQLRNATMSPLDDDRVDGFAHVGICQQVTQPSWGLFSQLAARQWAATPATLPGLTTLRPCQIHWAARVDPICDLREE